MSLPHGFRIYVVQAFPNQKKNKDPLEVTAGTPTAERILDLLEGLHREGTIYIEPARIPAAGEPEPPVKTITVGQLAAVRDDLYHLEVSIGEVGSHQMATRRGRRKTRDLKDWAPQAAHYVTFLFSPYPDADCFIVVSHTIKSSDPVPRLFSRMTALGIQEKRDAVARQQQARERAKQNGETPPRAVPVDRLLFDWNQAADNDYIEEIIEDADSASAIFESRIPSDRRGPDHVRRRLEIRLLDEDDRDIGKTISRRWSSRRQRGQETSKSEGVSELAALLEEQDLLDEGESEHYDNAVIAVKAKDRPPTRIAVDTLRDVFTYQFWENRPQVHSYYERVAPRLRTVARQLGIDVEDVNALEVDQCLDDSTSDRS